MSDEKAVTFREAFWVWVKVAIYSFGGPAGQIAVMHKMVVEEKKWVNESRFLHALNYCMLLPGPEAQQLAIYLGWLLHGTRGGLVAGTLFVLPGFSSILGLSVLYAVFHQVTLVQGLFFGLKPAVMAVVLEAVIKIGRRALKNNVMLGLAILSFIAIFFFNIPFPLIILTAGFIGYAGGYLKLPQFSTAANTPTDTVDELRNPTRPSWGRTARILAIGLTLWFAPLLLLVEMFGRESIFVRQGLFFSQMAMVTFGGAYSALVYVAQQAVEVYGWLTPREMLDGLGMAETTPGPLIQVVQFVAFMGAYRQPGLLHPIAAGVIASMITTWVTFVPCFIWIFLGAPYIEQLRGHRALSTALAAITAAVVGVILNLAVWFSLHTIFGVVNVLYTGPIRWQIPVAATLDGAALVIALIAGVMLFYYKRGMLETLAGCALLGLGVYVVR